MAKPRVPIYVGFRTGNGIERVGFRSKYIQQFAQNWLLHQGPEFAWQHLYLNYDFQQKGLWSYGGWYNPHSIWGH